MKLELITVSGVKLDDTVYSITIPTSAGEIGVFPGHEPLVTIAVPGVITITKTKGSSDTELFAIGGGVVEVSQEKVRILVDAAETSDDIIESEAKAALERAQKLAGEAKNQVELNKAHELIDRHSVRLKVAGLRRHKRR